MAMKRREGHAKEDMTTISVRKLTRGRINKIRGAKMKETGKACSNDDVVSELLDK